jgi:hypothetical protein
VVDQEIPRDRAQQVVDQEIPRERELPPRQSLLQARNQSSARASFLNNGDALTISNSGRGIIINIPRKLRLEPSSSANKSCPNLKPLYDQIMVIDLNGRFQFHFQGETGVDASGLTKIVYDKLFPIYKKLYFVDAAAKGEFILLKDDISIEELNRDTDQIIRLAIAARSQIYLQIHPQLIKLILSPNPQENITKRQNFNKLYANLKVRISQLINSGENISNYFPNPNQAITSADNINKLNKLTKEVKSEILLRKQLFEFGFTSWKQYENMATFIKSFWNNPKKPKLIYQNKRDPVPVERPLFSCELKYDIETFKKRLRIKIENPEEFLNLDRIPQSLYGKYPAFGPLIEYILNPSAAADINRRKFVKYVAGTEYTFCDIDISLKNREIPAKNAAGTKLYELPFESHTCFSALYLWKTPSSRNYLEVWTVARIDEEITKGSGLAAHN